MTAHVELMAEANAHHLITNMAGAGKQQQQLLKTGGKGKVLRY